MSLLCHWAVVAVPRVPVLVHGSVLGAALVPGCSCRFRIKTPCWQQRAERNTGYRALHGAQFPDASQEPWAAFATPALGMGPCSSGLSRATGCSGGVGTAWLWSLWGFHVRNSKQVQCRKSTSSH